MTTATENKKITTRATAYTIKKDDIDGSTTWLDKRLRVWESRPCADSFFFERRAAQAKLAEIKESIAYIPENFRPKVYIQSCQAVMVENS